MSFNKLKKVVFLLLFFLYLPIHPVYASTPTYKTILLFSWGLKVDVLPMQDGNRDDYLAIKIKDFSITELKGATAEMNGLYLPRKQNAFWTVTGKNYGKEFLLVGYTANTDYEGLSIFLLFIIRLSPFLLLVIVFNILHRGKLHLRLSRPPKTV